MKKHTLFIILIIGIALAIGIWRDHHVTNTSEVKAFTSSSLRAGVQLPSPQALPPFSLMDMEGKAFTPDSLKTHWTFLFFGYSHCPHICPTTLSALTQISQRISHGPHIQFVFITIDPEQDPPSQLKSFLSKDAFKAGHILGVTGDKVHIQDLAKNIGVHVGEAQNTVPTEHIEHGGAILLINPDGELTAVFTASEKPHAIARDFQEIAHRFAKA